MATLQAVSDVGRLRKINEDYVFFCRHPEDENIVLLIVADGMGGKEQGDVASKEVAADIEAWFYQTNVDVVRNIGGVSELLDKRVKKINKYLIDKYCENYLGTTLSLAIVGLDKTLFYNIGDSRGYIYKKKELIQVTEDDSGVWMFYSSKKVNKDDLRFFPTNNFITACIGLNNELCNSRSYIVPNDYKMILLLTDGVTDLLGDNDIKKIIEKKKDKDILKNIINVAVNKDLKLKVPLRLKQKYQGKFTVPIHGRDNASGVIFIKD